MQKQPVLKGRLVATREINCCDSAGSINFYLFLRAQCAQLITNDLLTHQMGTLNPVNHRQTGRLAGRSWNWAQSVLRSRRNNHRMWSPTPCRPHEFLLLVAWSSCCCSCCNNNNNNTDLFRILPALRSVNISRMPMTHRPHGDDSFR